MRRTLSAVAGVMVGILVIVGVQAAMIFGAKAGLAGTGQASEAEMAENQPNVDRPMAPPADGSNGADGPADGIKPEPESKVHSEMVLPTYPKEAWYATDPNAPAPLPESTKGSETLPTPPVSTPAIVIPTGKPAESPPGVEEGLQPPAAAKGSAAQTVEAPRFEVKVPHPSEPESSTPEPSTPPPSDPPPAESAAPPLVAESAQHKGSGSPVSPVLRTKFTEVTPEARDSLLYIWSETRSQDRQKRYEAVCKLQQLGETAVPLLMEIWQRGNPADADAVAVAIGKLKPKAEVVRDIFVKDLRNHAEKDIRAAAAMALGKIQEGHDETLDALIAGLQDKEPAVVSRCVFALAEIGASAAKASPDLVKLVKRSLDEHGKFENPNDADVPGAAVRALAAIDREGNREFIMRSCMTLLRKDRENVIAISHAIWALADMGAAGKDAVPLLVEFIVYPERCPCVRERVQNVVDEVLAKRRGGNEEGAPSLGQGQTPPQQADVSESKRETPASKVRHVNGNFIHVKCDVSDVGKSGVAAVAIWRKTVPGGWDKAPIQAFPQPKYSKGVVEPITIRLEPKDGLYGYTLIATSGVDQAIAPPTGDDPPQILVRVNRTPPEVKIGEVCVGAGADAGAVKITWDTRHPADLIGKNCITISSSPNSDGPWTPLHNDKLPNNGQYLWHIPADCEPRMFFKVEAEDLAGNIGHEISNPIVVEQNKLKTQIQAIEIPGKP